MTQEFIRNLVLSVPGFLLAIVCHEWAHGYVAKMFGDNTAEQNGRLTLNPVAHIDPVGTIIWPLICLLFPGGIMFGYAKPVPVNPSRFKDIKKGIFWVSFAGPLMNILLGVLFSLMLAAVAIKMSPGNEYYHPLVQMCKNAVMINFVLAVFNLIPFPPLDGSRMVSVFLNYEQNRKYESLQRYSLLFLMLLWFTNILNYIMLPAIIAMNTFPALFGRLLS